MAFFLPTAYSMMLVLEDLLHFGGGVGGEPGTAARVTVWLFYLIPLLALALCWGLVALSPIRSAQKMGWAAFSFIAMGVQFAALFISLGVFYMARHGLEGVF